LPDLFISVDDIRTRSFINIITNSSSSIPPEIADGRESRLAARISLVRVCRAGEQQALKTEE
jgi:hypothetical protein